jgi:nucleotide-binding universal stress UspA family protein
MQAASLSFKPTHILVPIDFSSSSTAALAIAEDLAVHFHARLLLLHVIPAFPITTGVEFPTTFYPREDFIQAAQDRAEALLQTSVNGSIAKGLQARFIVEVGNDAVGIFWTRWSGSKRTWSCCPLMGCQGGVPWSLGQ